MKLITTGPREGKTYITHGVSTDKGPIQFVDGLAEIPGNSQTNAGILHRLNTKYAVYPVGMVPKGLLKNPDGLDQPKASPQPNPPEAVPSDVRPSGEPVAEEAPSVSDEPAPAETGTTEHVPNGEA